MSRELSRRDVLRSSVATITALGAMSIPHWAFPAMAEGEELVEFVDYPDGWVTVRDPTRRFLDLREIDGAYTPDDKFFTTQHYGHPHVEVDRFRLQVTGLVNNREELSLDDIRHLGERELVAGFECSGNTRRAMQGLVSNARWTGVPLQKVLSAVGVEKEAREVVFFGADRGKEKVKFRASIYEVEQQYGRSISLDQAMDPAPFLATSMNGSPLTVHQGFPLRLIMPGWYGAPNVKWLTNIHLQSEPYLGKFQARWYRTLRSEVIGGELKWKETAITRMRLKSVIARITRQGNVCKVLGFALNDGTPLKSVEVRVDEDSWQAAKIEPSESKYGWKLFNYEWKNPTQGEHTIVSRVTDVNGEIQPEAHELINKKTFLEDNSQHPRKVRVSYKGE